MRGWIRVVGRLAVVLLVSTPLGCGGAREDRIDSGQSRPAASSLREDPFVRRPLQVFDGSRWLGAGIAYGPYRDGQFPGGPSPTRDELRQDLRLLSKHWQMLRVYGAVGPTETILELIREDALGIKLMLGIWIDVEERLDEDGQVVEELPAARTANRREIESAVRLAAAYPDIVRALSVGNETQVFWSSHRVPLPRLLEFVREVRARTRVPVTVADDFNFWNKSESRVLARELDFIVTHLHPLWNGLQLEEALSWTQRVFAEVQAMHPEQLVVLGETGWATMKHDEGEQARLIKGRPGEAQQKFFYDGLTAWIKRERIPTFFFEAFDENWKGGEHPDEVEKHWGLFRADRTAKKALAGGS